MSELIFLKLGGSLITDKDQAHTALIPRIDSLCGQIKEYLFANPNAKLVLGHGSGSFGHHAAEKYHTRSGVQTPSEWQGFAEVWSEARALNTIVVDRLNAVGLPVVSFPFSASGMAENQSIISWDGTPIQLALASGLLPVIYGDIAFDRQLGGTIVSTEEQFAFLAHELQPARILLTGIEMGIWRDFPTCTDLIDTLSYCEFAEVKTAIAGSASVDVTGGMASKVSIMFDIIQKYPALTARIFSGAAPDALLQALRGDPIGTILTI